MTRTLCSLPLAVLCAVGTEPAAATHSPVVSQLHVLSIHVPDAAAFDAMLRLLGETLGLPKVYGDLSQPGSIQRLYAGFSVGNAYLEPCGPYPTDAPFTPEQRARFRGLTFGPAASIDTSAEEMTRRKISHVAVSRPGGRFRFTHRDGAGTSGGRLSVGLWEVQDEQDRVNLRFVRDALRDAKGGPLGVRGLKEVRVGYADNAGLDAWGNFLAPGP